MCYVLCAYCDMYPDINALTSAPDTAFDYVGKFYMQT